MKSFFRRIIPLVFVLSMLVCPDFAGGKKVKEKELKEVDKIKKELTGWLKATKMRRLSNLCLAPDSSRIAFTVSEIADGGERKSNIRILNLKTFKSRRFTTSIKADHSPKWSPDGKSLAFLSNRYEKTQIYIIPLDGGEAEALTESKTGISSFEWSPSGSRIAFLSPEPETKEEKKKKQVKDDARVVDADKRHPLLRIIDIKTKQEKTLTKSNWRISEYKWLPKGDSLIIFATDHQQPELFTHKIYEISAASGEMKLKAAPGGAFSGLKISPSGKTLAYIGSRIDGPDPYDLYLLPVSGGKPRNLTAGCLDRQIANFTYLSEEVLLTLAQTRFTGTFYTISIDKKIKKSNSFKVNPSGSFAANSEIVAFVGETALTAPELYLSKKFAPCKKITAINKEWQPGNPVQPEFITYKSFDQREIEAALYKPKNHKEGDRLPLIVWVHGGPSGRFSDRFDSWAQLFSARGYAVLCPNIRGSTGYGFEFMAANRYDWGGGDFKDIMAGAGFLVEKGIADSDRLGIAGWSYGGYMAAWAVTQTNRFKAAVSGAPMTDLAFEYGAEMSEINAYDTWYLGTPYENLDRFIRMSPMTYVKNVKTPTLILCGENDPVDPIGQCKQFYRGLRRCGVVTKFVIYPREGHGIGEEKHRVDRLFRVLDWFKTHL